MNAEKPWLSERTVSIELARKLVSQQFPSLEVLSLEKIGEGWDNIAYLVNRQFVFRFPRREFSAYLIQTEYQVLSKICHLLPIPIPKPQFFGKPSEEYPWYFLGYELLKGKPACSVNLSHQERLNTVKDLAIFLKALHKLPTFEAPMDLIGRLDIRTRSQKAQTNLRQIEKLNLCNTAPLFHLLKRTSYPRKVEGPKVLCHGDLYIRHLLIGENKRICGVIDWGDLHIGNPAIDFQILFASFPKESHDIFFEHYGDIDHDTRELSILRSLYSATVFALYAHDINDKDLLREALFSFVQLSSL